MIRLQRRAEIGSHLATGAVYEALGILNEKRSSAAPGSPPLCEDQVGGTQYHVTVRTCGKTVYVDRAIGDTLYLSAAADSGCQVDEAKVIYCGTCPERLVVTRRRLVTEHQQGDTSKSDQPTFNQTLGEITCCQIPQPRASVPR